MILVGVLVGLVVVLVLETYWWTRPDDPPARSDYCAGWCDQTGHHHAVKVFRKDDDPC